MSSHQPTSQSFIRRDELPLVPGRAEARPSGEKLPSGWANPWLQLALSVLCVLVSELLLKRGANEIANAERAWSWTGINGLTSPLVWLAILFIIASFITWLYVLKCIPLSIAFPLSRVVDALVPICCWIFLGEAISLRRWIGIALVVIGLAIIARPVARMEERL